MDQPLSTLMILAQPKQQFLPTSHSRLRAFLKHSYKWQLTSVRTIPVTSTHQLVKLPSFFVNRISDSSDGSLFCFRIKITTTCELLTVDWSDQQECNRPLCFVIIT